MVSTIPVSLAKQAFQPIPLEMDQQPTSHTADASSRNEASSKLKRPTGPSKRGRQSGSGSIPAFQPVFPPLLSSAHHRPNTPFLQTLIHALKRVPVRLRKALSDWGYTIVTAPSIITPPQSLNPHPVHMLQQFVPGRLLHKLQSDLTVAGWWKTITSSSSWAPKTILMPETGWLCLGMVAVGDQLQPIPLDSHRDGLFRLDQFRLFPSQPERPGLILLHELGHATDDFLGWIGLDGRRRNLSQTLEFSLAYQQDIAKIPNKRVLEELSYYLPRAEDPMDWKGCAKSEAFAEVFARLKAPNYGHRALRQEDAQFLSHFPQVSAFIRTYVLEPWRSEAKSGSQGSAPGHRRQHRRPKEDSPNCP